VTSLTPPATGDDWVGLSAAPLPAAEAADWAVLPSCGAVVAFTGTSRDHSGTPGTADARTGVTVLEYEAYDEQVVPRLDAVVVELRRRWPDVGRVVLLHRTGPVPVGTASVVVVVSAPHRDHAFEAARFGIDTVKATVPIWKREIWRDGSAWGLDGQDIRAAGDDGRVASDEPVEARPRSGAASQR
jgi:molybdopterin synthase catalytic subunit